VDAAVARRSGPAKSETAGKSEAKTEAEPADPQVQIRRAAQRQGRVQSGIEELSLWLENLVRQGLAWAQTQPPSFWEQIASRMVDAQAPGLARLIRNLAALPGGPRWLGDIREYFPSSIVRILQKDALSRLDISRMLT